MARARLPVADHAGDVEVLDHDRVRRADQAGAGAVQEVAPGVADLAVGAGDLGRGLGPVGRPLLAAGQAPLVAGQVAGLALQVPRVGDLLPVGGHGEVRHAEIDADGVPGLRRGTGAAASTVKVTYQRPSGSRETITIAGSSAVTSTSGQDQTNRSGVLVLASRSSPPRMVNAERV